MASEVETIAQTHRCAECNGRLMASWEPAPPPNWGQGRHVLKCTRDASHHTFRAYRATKRLADGRIYDVNTQRPVDENQALAIPKDESGMLKRVSEAQSIGLFPDSRKNPLTQEQLIKLAKLALLYELDPLMREIMPYQGLPYITIEGRRRIDARAGHRPSIKFRPLTGEEKDMYEVMGAIQQGDICICCFLSTEYGNSIEAFGRVKKSERQGDYHLPTVSWSLEMAMKRAESRARKMAYGPVALPGGLDSRLRVVEEGDVIEGEWKDVDRITGEIQESEPEEWSVPMPEGEVLAMDKPDYTVFFEAAKEKGYAPKEAITEVLGLNPGQDWNHWLKMGADLSTALKRLEKMEAKES